MNRKSAFAIAALLSAQTALAQFGAEPAELELIRVQNDVYVIHNAYVPGNITAVIGDESVLLVDTKFAIDYDNAVDLLRTVTDNPVKYVINTHYHDDHSGATSRHFRNGYRDYHVL